MKQPIPFGKYYLLERINVGGMAEVFKAKAIGVEGFERLVAVKRILPSIAADDEFITMFVDEAKIAVQLTHANIAQIFDLGRVDGSFFIALEYVHGKDLRTMFNRTRQRGEILPIPLTCYVIMKLCEGLDYAHNKQDSSNRSLNLVHRDVSPQNILVSYEGEVKIVDFGIAKAVGKVGRTQAGILKGKFGYMSPDQVLGLEIDRRSDVFGVGICLYELLTGERLFVAETDFATLEKVRSVDVMPPSTYNRRIPEELEQIVMRALARDREERHQSALQLHDDLQAFMHTSGNLFARKDLSAYMHRAFAEEIEKESARDREFEQLDHSLEAREPGQHAEARAESHAVHEVQASRESRSALDDFERRGQDQDQGHVASDAFSMPPTAAHADWEMPAYGSQPQPESRRRTATLLGVPPIASPRIPAVPRPVPGPASVPPVASSRPPAPFPLLPGRAAQNMEWDEDELSTQIYDKPDPSAAGDDLGRLRVSVPDGADPELAPVAPRASKPGRRTTGAAAITGVPHTGVPPHGLRTDSPSGLGVRARDDDATTLRPPRSRPMWGPVVAVIAIVSTIVGALYLFRQQRPATLNLTTQPGHVAISVDGHALGESTSPLVIGELTPGRRHDVVVSSPGHHDWTRAIELAPGQVMTLTDVVLQRIETGFSLASTPPGASVFVDDKPRVERTPVRVTDLTPGEHRVRVEHEGSLPWEGAVQVKSGTVLPLPEVVLQPAAPKRDEPAENEPPARGSRKYGWHRGSRTAPVTDEPQIDDEAPEPSSRAGREEPAAPDPGEPEPPAPEPARAAPAEVSAESAERASAPPARASARDVAAEMGKLRVNSRPWSNVFIDGQPYGHTPRFNIELPVGSHTIELVNDEFGIRKSVEISIEAGKTTTRVINLMD